MTYRQCLQKARTARTIASLLTMTNNFLNFSIQRLVTNVTFLLLSTTFLPGESFVFVLARSSQQKERGPSSSLPRAPFAPLFIFGKRGENAASLETRKIIEEPETMSNVANNGDSTITTSRANADDDKSNGMIVTSSNLDLPFSAEVAYDAFSDLTRQPAWSPWLRSVQYIENDSIENGEDRETVWTMGVFGVSLSWNAVQTQMERGKIIAWESTKGLKNYGRVDFQPLRKVHEDGQEVEGCNMSLTLTFVAPRIAVNIIGRSNRIQRIVERRFLQSTLTNFRDAIEQELKTKNQTMGDSNRNSSTTK